VACTAIRTADVLAIAGSRGGAAKDAPRGRHVGAMGGAWLGRLHGAAFAHRV